MSDLTIPTILLNIPAMGVPLPVIEPGLPTGHKGQRGAMLTQLKRAQPLTARELSVKLGISLNAVRHHLKELEAEGLILHQREHHGVGAPVFAYTLTPAGEELFPRRYGEALSALLSAVVERDGREAAVGMLESYFGLLGGRMRAELQGVPQAERLDAVARLLSQEGYMAEVRVEEDTRSRTEAVLVEHNCPIPAVAGSFPEICAAEAKYLADVLGAEVERTGHILNGCPACEYRVRFSRAAEERS
jgi:DeoR family transcriptional regulator, suf operon transcriptional repressor